MVRFVTYKNQQDKWPQRPRLELEDFFTFLSEHEETDCAPCPGGKCRFKDGLAWAPGCPVDGTSRLGANIESFDVVAFDCDHLAEAEFEAVCGRFNTVDCLVYSTHSHKPPDNYCVRIVCSLSRRILAHEYLAFWYAAVRRYQLPADPKAKDPSRLFFTPRCPKGAPRINVRNEGVPLDVDALLVSQQVFSRQVIATAPVKVELAVPEPGEVDLKGLRKFIQRYDPDDDSDGVKREMIRRVLAGEPLADKPGKSTVEFKGPAVYGRDTAVFRVANIVGLLLPLGTPVDAALELLRPAIAAIPQYEDDGDNETLELRMEKARVNLEKIAKEKLSSADALSKLIARTRAKSNSRNTERNSYACTASGLENRGDLPEGPRGDQGSQGDPGGGQEDQGGPAKNHLKGHLEEDPDAWRLQLKTRYIKGGIVVPEQVGMNVAVVLAHHPEWKGVLKFNELTKEVDCFGGPLPEKNRVPVQLRTAVENWLQSNENLNLHSQIVKSQIFHVARNQVYDPLKGYLSKVGPTWDEVPRIETFLETYLGVQPEIELSWYIREVSRRWFIAAVARGLEPGCKADNVLVLEGEQNIGKSFAVQALGGEFYADAQIRLTDKDSMMLAAQSWIIELSELSSMRGVETEAQKGFFSRREDRFRPPYGEFVERFPRRCLFVGTVNPDESGYLMDITGNRRYWPVRCTVVDYDGIRRDRDQLWAEAVTMYKAGKLWWFSKEESDLMESVVDQRLKSSSIDEAISDWWSEMEPSKRPLEFRIHDIGIDVLKLAPDAIDPKNRAIGRALAKLGFDKYRRRDGHRVKWVYVSTEEQRGMPRVDSRLKRKLSVIMGGKTTP